MLLEFTELSHLDKNKLMQVYREGNLQHADSLYPHLVDRRFALKLAERDFIDYLARYFLRPGRAYMVQTEDGVWLSALRLSRVYPELYYIEALETRPDRRREGHAVRLLTNVIALLQSRGPFVLRDCVSKTNLASLSAHKKAGFTEYCDPGFDYLAKETHQGSMGMEYRSGLCTENTSPPEQQQSAQ